MDKRIITVSIIGVGARGGETYGRYTNELKDKYRIVSLCDPDEARLNKYGDIFNVSKDNRFNDETTFFSKKRSDVIFITTQDKLHVRMAKVALNLGYDILLEKPISDDIKELQSLVKTAKSLNRKIMVCHVLRYTAAIKKVKEILDSGEIGQLVSIDQTENVVFWHQAHSFVRGNWRNSNYCAPMIMQKCCHDLDLLQYFANSKCVGVSSMGRLAYFLPENKPEGSADRCVDCKYIETCPYSAKKIYIDNWIIGGKPASSFPSNIITNAYPLTEEAIQKGIEETPYGRCVYSCDNNVVDNQTVIMQFENGITATLKMEAFVKYGGRDIRFFGSLGELEMREFDNTITLKRYFGEDTVWKISDLTDDLEGHGGGDHRMIDKFYDVIKNGEDADTAIENSVESHYIALAAEKSRLHGGKLIKIKH